MYDVCVRTICKYDYRNKRVSHAFVYTKFKQNVIKIYIFEQESALQNQTHKLFIQNPKHASICKLGPKIEVKLAEMS